MAINFPTLDDRSYDELVAEAIARIPSLAPSWTDHNPSDPGIAVVEMLAWLTDILLYRVGQIPDPVYESFLRLLNGPSSGGTLESRTEEALRSLRTRYRAVTAADYVELVTETWPVTPVAEMFETVAGLTTDSVSELLVKTDVDGERTIGTVTDDERDRLAEEVSMMIDDEPIVELLGPGRGVARANVVPRRNLSSNDPAERDAAPGHLTVAIIPEATGSAEPTAGHSSVLTKALERWLDPRRLIGTRHHVVLTAGVQIGVSAEIFVEESARRDEVQKTAMKRVLAHLHPKTGGPDGVGWPYGRDVHTSELYQLLLAVPGVDHVGKVLLSNPHPERMRSNHDSSIQTVRVEDYEVALGIVHPGDIVVVS